MEPIKRKKRPLTQLSSPLLNTPPCWHSLSINAHMLRLCRELYYVDRSIAPIVVQRVKRQPLRQNPLHEAIFLWKGFANALQPYNPKITGSAEAISVLN